VNTIDHESIYLPRAPKRDLKMVVQFRVQSNILDLKLDFNAELFRQIVFRSLQAISSIKVLNDEPNYQGTLGQNLDS